MSTFLLVFSCSQQVHKGFGGFSSFYKALLKKSVFFKETLEKCLGLFKAFDVFFRINGGEGKIISLSLKKSKNIGISNALALDAVEVMECLGFI